MNGVKTPAPTAEPWRATSRRDRTPCLTKEKGLPLRRSSVKSVVTDVEVRRNGSREKSLDLPIRLGSVLTNLRRVRRSKPCWVPNGTLATSQRAVGLQYDTIQESSRTVWFTSQPQTIKESLWICGNELPHRGMSRGFAVV